MPDMDGFQTTVKLRNIPEFGGTIIMMLGSAAPQQDAERCLAIEVSLYMVKPIKIRSLLETLQNLTSPAKDVIPSLSLPKLEEITAPSLRILLAEDNPVNQQLAIRLLQKMKHTVVLAENGKHALDALEKASF